MAYFLRKVGPIEASIQELGTKVRMKGRIVSQTRPARRESTPLTKNEKH